MLLIPITSEAGLPEFDSARAWEHLTAQCRLGPRVPGTAGHAACLSYLERTLAATGGETLVHPFKAIVADRADTMELANVVARFGPPGQQALLLGAHWDTRPRAEKDRDPTHRDRPILGANDGASGVAVLLTLAELFADVPPPILVEIVLFDGEDQGREGHTTDYALGSQEHARRLVSPGPQAVIILDMVGGVDLHICREGQSEQYAGWLNDILFSRALALGLSGFDDRVCYSIYDDHVPFLQAGVPAVDLVDMHYRQWHTHLDVPEFCSQQSLAQVGALLVDFLYGGSLR